MSLNDDSTVISVHYRSIASTCLYCKAAPEAVRASVAEDGHVFIAMLCLDHAMIEARLQTKDMTQIGVSDYFRTRADTN